MIVTFYLYFLSVTDIEDERPSHKDIPDLLFPVAQADINECSTYAVVCRLKSSPTYTITSTGGLFIHPDYPGVTVTIPENAVAPESTFVLELKVGVIKKVYFFICKIQLVVYYQCCVLLKQLSLSPSCPRVNSPFGLRPHG